MIPQPRPRPSPYYRTRPWHTQRDKETPMIRPSSLLPFAFCLLPSLALAQAQPRINTPKEDAATAAASDVGRFSLTVYSTADPATFDPQDFLNNARENPGAQPIPGFGVVREIRKLSLTKGDNQVKFTDVASAIDPTTVAFKS